MNTFLTIAGYLGIAAMLLAGCFLVFLIYLGAVSLRNQNRWRGMDLETYHFPIDIKTRTRRIR
jgi:hypothetical protein